MFSHVLEPVQLIGEGKYNLNALKEFEATESFLSMDQATRKCQNKESLDSCNTRHYLAALVDQCGCLPFNIRINNTVRETRIPYGQSSAKLHVIMSSHHSFVFNIATD